MEMLFSLSLLGKPFVEVNFLGMDNTWKRNSHTWRRFPEKWVSQLKTYVGIAVLPSPPQRRANISALFWRKLYIYELLKGNTTVFDVDCCREVGPRLCGACPPEDSPSKTIWGQVWEVRSRAGACCLWPLVPSLHAAEGTQHKAGTDSKAPGSIRVHSPARRICFLKDFVFKIWILYRIFFPLNVPNLYWSEWVFSESRVGGGAVSPLSSVSVRVGYVCLSHPIISSAVCFDWGVDPALLTSLKTRSGLKLWFGIQPWLVSGTPDPWAFGNPIFYSKYSIIFFTFYFIRSLGIFLHGSL